jgi:hypothetical protein
VAAHRLIPAFEKKENEFRWGCVLTAVMIPGVLIFASRRPAARNRVSSGTAKLHYHQMKKK